MSGKLSQAQGMDPRYRVVASAFVVQGMIIGCLFSYSVFFKSLETEFGWSRTLLSASNSLAFLVMGLLVFFGGRLTDRYGPRIVLTLSGLIYGAGYVLMGAMDQPWQLLALFAVCIGVGLSTHDVVTLSTVARWFGPRRGMMTGIVKVGTACGQFTIPLVVTALILNFGWRTAIVIMGVGATALLLLAAQGMRRPSPDEEQAIAARIAASGASTKSGAGMTLAEARGTRAFWTLCLIQFCFMPSLVTLPLHIVPHGTDLGMSVIRAATLLSLIAASSVVGRLFIGTATDRIGGRRALALCLALLFSSVVWLSFADVPWMLFAFAAAYGVGHGGLFTVVSPTVAEYFGMRAHGAIFGAIIFFGTLGGAVAPIAAGRAFDTTGSYTLAFAALAVLALLGLIAALTLRKPKPLPVVGSATIAHTGG